MSSPDNGLPYSIGSSTFPGLGKLIEEAGEVLQVAGKFIGAGGDVAHWDGTNLRDRMIEELGDLGAAMNFFVHQNFTATEQELIMERTYAKFDTFEGWQNG